MNLDLTKRWIERWEGRRHIAYDDATGKTIAPGMRAEGNPSIGVGLNLLTSRARSLMSALGLEYSSVLTGETAVADEQLDYCLNATVQDAVGAARAIIPTFDYLPDNLALVLTDLAFNMGEARLRGFVHMLNYFRLAKYVLAADELRNSAWFHQVGRRAVADVAVLGGTADPEAILAG